MIDPSRFTPFPKLIFTLILKLYTYLISVQQVPLVKMTVSDPIKQTGNIKRKIRQTAIHICCRYPLTREAGVNILETSRPQTCTNKQKEETRSLPNYMLILYIYLFYRIILVPVLPLSASSSLSIDVIIADSPPDSIKSTAASIFGPILPGGN